jgi:hypothetical protein
MGLETSCACLLLTKSHEYVFLFVPLSTIPGIWGRCVAHSLLIHPPVETLKMKSPSPGRAYHTSSPGYRPARQSTQPRSGCGLVWCHCRYHGSRSRSSEADPSRPRCSTGPPSHGPIPSHARKSLGAFAHPLHPIHGSDSHRGSPVQVVSKICVPSVSHLMDAHKVLTRHSQLLSHLRSHCISFFDIENEQYLHRIILQSRVLVYLCSQSLSRSKRVWNVGPIKYLMPFPF